MLLDLPVTFVVGSHLRLLSTQGLFFEFPEVRLSSRASGVEIGGGLQGKPLPDAQLGVASSLSLAEALLPQAFVKIAKEFEQTQRFINAISLLVDVTEGQAGAPPEWEPFLSPVQSTAAVSPNLLAGLLDGSLLPAASLVHVPARLFFDVESLGIENPLITRLAPTIKAVGEIAVALTAVLGLLTQCTDISKAVSSYKKPILTCEIESKLWPARSTVNETCQIYLRELEQGGVRTAQEYLRAARFYSGPVDGFARLDGSTNEAARKFCQSRGGSCPNVEHPEFRRLMAEYLAVNFPMRSPLP